MTVKDDLAGYARVALQTVGQEFPYHLRHVMQGPGDHPALPRDVHPAFYGSFDWHSCVEMQWTLVRLWRTAPESLPRKEIRAMLDERLSAAALGAEAAYCAANPGHSRPYGLGWVLQLAHEAAACPDEDGQRWAANLSPLAEVAAANFVRWLPKLTYPVRHGAHMNTAFGLSRALAWAEVRAGQGDRALRDAIGDAAHRLFGADRDYPGHYEPCGADFLSPALTEAELMACLLDPAEFGRWLHGFLPGIAGQAPAELFIPATVSDPTDGQIAHLHGLNLSRAWCWRRLAESLPPGDPRIEVMRAGAETHAAAALPHVSGSDYMVEHWLAAYAVLYLT